MTVPLRHFIAGLGFLLLGTGLGTARELGILAGQPLLVHIHLLLAGWVCVTIMGAMTQFVPVWSGVELHSRRIAWAQLWLVVGGLIGFVGAFLAGVYELIALGGLVMLFGFWLFVYNIGRTLVSSRPWDVTERHFAIALGFFVLVTGFGVALAFGYTRSIFSELPVTQGSVRLAHATLAVYGAVLTTIFGALYQLSTMFTQTKLHGIDTSLQRVEAFGFPVGVVALAGGRLLEITLLARLGGVLIVISILGVSVILTRRLYEAQVPWTPMLRRYTVVAVTMAVWALWSGPYWIRDPLDPTTLFGAPGAVHLLTLGIIGFVVLGTLYHVIPFIIWVHRYSDLLGLQDVPMIDDLYDERLAIIDFTLLTGGVGILVIVDSIQLPTTVAVIGGVSVTAGATVFLVNMLLVIRRHSPQTLPGILFDRFAVEEPVSAGTDIESSTSQQ